MCLGQALPGDLSLPFTLDHKGFVEIAVTPWPRKGVAKGRAI